MSMECCEVGGCQKFNTGMYCGDIDDGNGGKRNSQITDTEKCSNGVTNDIANKFASLTSGLPSLPSLPSWW